MKEVTWSTELYGTGIPIIDEEHQELFECINEIIRTIGDTKTSSATLRKLEGIVERHFSNEEEMFVATRYPQEKAHVSAHNMFRRKLREAIVSFDKDHILDVEFVEFLYTWLSRHIRGMDRAYVHFINGVARRKSYSVLVLHLERIVRKKQGGKAWKRVVKAVGTKAPTTEKEIVDDSLLESFFSAALEVLQISANELFEDYGFEWVLSMRDGPHGSKMKALGTDFADVIRGLDRMHEALAEKAFPNLAIPGFSVEVKEPCVVEVTFTPTRPSRMAWGTVVLGMLKGVGVHLCRLDCEVKEIGRLERSIVFEVRLPEAEDLTTNDDELQSCAVDEANTEESYGHVSLRGKAIAKIFPFFFVVGKSGQVQAVGPSLRKVVPALCPGAVLSGWVAVRSPPPAAGRFSVGVAQRFQGQVFSLDVRSKSVDTEVPRVFSLRGEFLQVRNGSRLLFAGAPMFNSLAEAADLGLELNDFAVSDRSVLLMLRGEESDEGEERVEPTLERKRSSVIRKRSSRKRLPIADRSDLPIPVSKSYDDLLFTQDEKLQLIDRVLVEDAVHHGFGLVRLLLNAGDNTLGGVVGTRRSVMFVLQHCGYAGDLVKRHVQEEVQQSGNGNPLLRMDSMATQLVRAFFSCTLRKWAEVVVSLAKVVMEKEGVSKDAVALFFDGLRDDLLGVPMHPDALDFLQWVFTLCSKVSGLSMARAALSNLLFLRTICPKMVNAGDPLLLSFAKEIQSSLNVCLDSASTDPLNKGEERIQQSIGGFYSWLSSTDANLVEADLKAPALLHASRERIRGALLAAWPQVRDHALSHPSIASLLMEMARLNLMSMRGSNCAKFEALLSSEGIFL